MMKLHPELAAFIASFICLRVVYFNPKKGDLYVIVPLCLEKTCIKWAAAIAAGAGILISLLKAGDVFAANVPFPYLFLSLLC